MTRDRRCRDAGDVDRRGVDGADGHDYARPIRRRRSAVAGRDHDRRTDGRNDRRRADRSADRRLRRRHDADALERRPGRSACTHTYQQAGGYTMTATRDRRQRRHAAIASSAIVVEPATLPTVTLIGDAESVTDRRRSRRRTFTVTATSAPEARRRSSSVRDARRRHGRSISGTGGGTFAYQFAQRGHVHRDRRPRLTRRQASRPHWIDRS